MKSGIEQALAQAIASGRQRVGIERAYVAVIAGSQGHAELLRRSLASVIPFIRVRFLTPEQLVNAYGQFEMARQGWRPEPPGWLSAFLSAQLPEMADTGLLGEHGKTLCQPGWRGSIEQVLGELEGAMIRPDMLVAQAVHDVRFGLLATLLQTVDKARHDAKIYSSHQVSQAALKALQQKMPHPFNEVQVAIVAGDDSLSLGAFDVLRLWLKQRDVTRLAMTPLEQIEPAPWGLRAACPDNTCVMPTPSGSGQLGHLRRHLFAQGPLATCKDNDDSVQLIATPDETREINEAVRVVLEAIGKGVPLDKIAIVLPDADHAVVLDDALQRAGIPAVWLTGPSLARSTCARFLLQALSLLNGEDTIENWYDLLQQPGFQGANQGRMRWRRLLAGCLMQRGTSAIISQLNDIADSKTPVVTDNEDSKDKDPDPDARAAVGLLNAIRRVQDALQSMPEQASIQDHARSWREFLRRFWQSEHLSPDVRPVLHILDAWSRGTGDAPLLSRASASSLFRDTVASTNVLSGSLTQPKIRVLPPMVTMGGGFEVVCVLGMSEERFPRKIQELALLSDSMIARLRDEGAFLLDSRRVMDQERRRLAAVCAGCVGRLWLASPRYEMLASKPQLPSQFLLDIASVLCGTRVSYERLHREFLTRRGSRSLPVTRTPDEAIGCSEFMIARVLAKPHQILPYLATHSIARRLLQLQRSIDRFVNDGATPDAWTGLVPADLLNFGSDPLTPGQFTLLMEDPARFFFRNVLGVFPAQRLRSGGRVLSEGAIERRILETIDGALGDSGDFEKHFFERWKQQLDRVAGRLHKDDTTTVKLLDALGHTEFQRIVRQRNGVWPSGKQVDVEAQQVFDELSLKISAQGPGPVTQDSVVVFAPDPGGNAINKKPIQHWMLYAAALRKQGVAIKTVEVSSRDGVRRLDVEQLLPQLKPLAEASWQRAQLGWWPSISPDNTFALSRERFGTSIDLEGMTERLNQLLKK